MGKKTHTPRLIEGDSVAPVMRLPRMPRWAREAGERKALLKVERCVAELGLRQLPSDAALCVARLVDRYNLGLFDVINLLWLVTAESEHPDSQPHLRELASEMGIRALPIPVLNRIAGIVGRYSMAVEDVKQMLWLATIHDRDQNATSIDTKSA